MLRIRINRTTFVVAIITLFMISSPYQSVASIVQNGWQEVQPLEIPDIDMDVDFDGIFDHRERALGTDPRSSDTDSDGFNDLFEYNYRAFGFNPLTRNVDDDGDGLSNAFEERWGTSPNNQDTDGDSFSDFDEIMNRRFGFDPVQITKDTDWDGIADRLEITIGSAPDDSDSNGDGVDDFQAFQAGLNPNMRIDADNLGEMVGKAYSAEMGRALSRMQAGRKFPAKLVRELPYPAVTRRLYGRQGRELAETRAVEPGSDLTPSAALMQQSVANKPILDLLPPPKLPAVYPEYNQVVSRLKEVAVAFDGSPNPNIVRLFRWSQTTEEHRRIYALKISDNPNLNEPATEHEILFMGLHHGRELITASFTLGLIRTLTEQYAAGDQIIETLVNGSEIWIIPIVNPDGYAKAVGERDQGANVNWRKNARKVTELDPQGHPQAEGNKGVDPCRNYGFEHVRNVPNEEIHDPEVNGMNSQGIFDPQSDTYAGLHPFSDVEALAVAGLASNSFFSGDEIDGIRCSLSWHTGGNGRVVHPMNHYTTDGLDGSDIDKLNCLEETFANAAGYQSLGTSYWDGYYHAYGTSDDWLYKHNGILAVTAEAYSNPEGANAGPIFFPEGRLIQMQVVNNNLNGAIDFMATCWLPFCP